MYQEVGYGVLKINISFTSEEGLYVSFSSPRGKEKEPLLPSDSEKVILFSLKTEFVN